MKSLVVASCLVSWCMVAPAHAQCPQWSSSFTAASFDDFGYALTVFDFANLQGPGLFAGGIFAGAGEINANRIARFGGGRWSALGSGMNSGVRALLSYGDSSGPAVVAGGAFTTAGGVACDHVAKWNGTAWSPLGSGFDDPVNALALFDDGSGWALYAAGESYVFGFPSVTHVSRWNGSSWSNVGSGLAGSNAAVDALFVFDDGSGPALYAGGKFTGGVARWDGATWSIVGGGVDARVFALGEFDDGSGPQLYAGGEFGVAGGNPAVRIARWNGTSWSAVPGITTTSQFVRALHVHDDGSGSALYVGGDFFVSGVTTDLARWNGTSWSAVSSGSQGPNATVRALTTFDAGFGPELVATGNFDKCDGVDTPFIGAWNGSSWRSLDAGRQAIVSSGSSSQGGVNALAQWDDPNDHRSLVVAGGTFVQAGDVVTKGVAGWDGVSWRAFGNGVNSAQALAVYDDPASGDEVLVAASTGIVGGATNFGGVAQWNGSAWSYLGWSPPQGQASSLAVYREGSNTYDSLFAAGSFTALSDFQPMAHISRWDGVLWTAVGGGVDGAVYALAVYDAPGATPESLYVSGNFNNAGSVNSPLCARWDGASWVAVGAPSAMRELVVYDEGAGPRLYGSSTSGLYSFDGTSWTLLVNNPFGNFSSSSYAIGGFDDGSGPGIYTGIGYRWRNSAWETYGDSGAIGTARSILAFKNGAGADRALFIGGDFTSFGGFNSPCLTRWSDPCATLTSYCTAKTNSQGCVPAIGWIDEPTVSASVSTPFAITASNVLNQKSGILFYGVFGRTAVPFQGGLNCVRSPVHRTPLRNSLGNSGPDDCSGFYLINFQPWIDGTNDALLGPGITVDAQWWSRDPASPSTTGLTDAIEFEIRP